MDMICQKCGKTIDSSSNFCTECGAEFKPEEKAEEVASTKAESVANAAYDEAKQLVKDVGLGAKEFAEKSIEGYKGFKNMSKEEQQEAVEQTKKKAKNFIGKEKENYKNFKTLTAKQKIVRIIIPLLVFIILINIFGGKSYKNDEDKAIAIALEQVDSQIYGGATVEIYDPVCVDKDGKGRYIVTVTSERNSFETWWVVMVILHPDGEHYRVAANYHGGGMSEDDWIEEYKTNSEYGWGTKIKDKL